MHTVSTIRGKTAVAVILILLASCSDPIAPVPPVWNVEANLPLAVRTFPIDELLSKSRSLRVSEDGEGLLILHQSYPFGGISLGDSVGIDDMKREYSESVGQLRFDIPELVRKDLALGSTFPELQNGRYIVPPIENGPPISIHADMRQYFQSISFAQGKIKIDFTNNYAIPVRFPTPVLITDLDGRILTSVSIAATLLPGQELTCPIVNLAGVTLPGEVRLIVPITTPGSGTTTVQVDRLQSLAIRVSLFDTRLQEALARFPEQHFSGDDQYDIAGQGLSIQRATFRTGMVTCEVVNHLETGGRMDIVIHGLQSGGEPHHEQFEIAPRSRHILNLPLSGMELLPIDGTHLRFAWDMDTPASGADFIRLSAMDSISVITRIEGVSFREFSGLLVSRSMLVERNDPLGMPAFDGWSGSFAFESVTGYIDARNTSSVPISVEGGTITGIQSRPEVRTELNIPAGMLVPGGTTRLPFSPAEVTAFFNAFGQSRFDRIATSSRLILNPAGGAVVVSERDSISGEICFDVPLRIVIEDGTSSDTTRISMDAETRKKFERVEYGEIIFEFENGLPLEVEVIPDLWDGSFKTILPKTGADPLPTIRIPAASVDASGKPLSPQSSKTTISLTGEEIRRISTAEYVLVRLVLNTNGATNVLFHSADYLKMRVYATLGISSKIAGK